MSLKLKADVRSLSFDSKLKLSSLSCVSIALNLVFIFFSTGNDFSLVQLVYGTDKNILEIVSITENVC